MACIEQEPVIIIWTGNVEHRQLQYIYIYIRLYTGRHVTSRHVRTSGRQAAVDKEAVTSRHVRTSHAPPCCRGQGGRPRHVDVRHGRTGAPRADHGSCVEFIRLVTRTKLWSWGSKRGFCVFPSTEESHHRVFDLFISESWWFSGEEPPALSREAPVDLRDVNGLPTPMKFLGFGGFFAWIWWIWGEAISIGSVPSSRFSWDQCRYGSSRRNIQNNLPKTCEDDKIWTSFYLGGSEACYSEWRCEAAKKKEETLEYPTLLKAPWYLEKLKANH